MPWLRDSISKAKPFGFHNSALGYEVSKNPDGVPGACNYFVPIYEDADERTEQD